MNNKSEKIELNSGESGPKKVEKVPNMERVSAINNASVALFDALKDHGSSLTDVEADILIKRLTHEFEEYLEILLKIRKAAFERRKERTNT